MSAAGAAPPVVCLLGPTASGKSAAAMAAAARHPIEIVSLDSAQVYRGMDIGTAKPTPEERAAVPHHLLDIIDPVQSYSAAQFAADALAAIAGIRARGKIPLVVGGTLLYYRALTEGLHDLPQADPAVRERLEAEAAQAGWPAMHARLAALDPDTARRLQPKDAQRIQRALEIIEISGKTMTELIRAEKTKASDTPAFLPIALEPADRAWLHARIAARFDQMLEQGLVAEVERLYRRRAGGPDAGLGVLHPDLPSIRCVGYRQVWSHLDGETSPVQMREQGVAATRQLAKRQLTWLRSMPEPVRIACDAPDATARALAEIDKALRSRPPRTA
ncbi:MAG: tRNA (adenosine(37)-N6)-dimethylallyltransferase MiaA [Candidatus Protistobacter heckmanni]|nr:tRNA (adenosine(37)-N6)-dimethylallyltransferase MiaA [Candidatus Protistobacter heckmanni]